jgi:ribosomal protein S18 acetylase RimI-like enzyme
MSDRTPIPLVPILIGLNAREFEEIRDWSFADAYVGRMLRGDIPRRMILSERFRIWIYLDPDGQIVGFGTLDVGYEYGDYTGGRPHAYIPLLAVNPVMEGRGHGKWIVRHLIGEAALLAGGSGGSHDYLFLDVYASNERAIGLYKKCGFIEVSDEPRPDPDEDDRPYIVMALRISGAMA